MRGLQQDGDGQSDLSAFSSSSICNSLIQHIRLNCHRQKANQCKKPDMLNNSTITNQCTDTIQQKAVGEG